jgi:hypothetical protein
VRAAEARAREQKSSRGGFGGKQMASQQVEWTVELQESEVRAELDWRVRGCERECSAGGRLSSIPQAMRVQDNRPRASRLRASGVRAEREQRAGDVTRHGDPAGGYAGVPAVFQRHMRVSSGGLARE